MNSDKRKRSPNWLPSEKELLLDIVEFHYNIVENKKTDGVSIKTKLAQWQTIADEYNSRTTHCSRTGENLKAQWESMKKVARKEAATNRKHIIQTGGGSPMPPKKEDPFHQRILSLICTSAVGLFNPYDSDSIVPAVQDQAAIPDVQTEVFVEPPPTQHTDIAVPLTSVTAGNELCSSTDNKGVTIDDQIICDTEILHDSQEFVTKDWGDYTPQLLRTPVSLALKISNNSSTNKKNEKQTPTNRSWVSRRRPPHTNTSSSLEQLHKKKMEAIELQKKLAVEEMERSKALHDIDIQIKKEILKQEKIKMNILLIKRRKLLNSKSRKTT